ncbi:MAG: hypothetical protein ACLSGI_05330 [Butyricicoccaceae bacterium]
MQSYEFPYPEAEQQTVVSRFGGIDCRTHPTKVSSPARRICRT